MDKFNGRYRISTTRLQNWDYGWNASYFITICTQNREQFFGEINNANMYLSKTGDLAKYYWYEIPKQFPYTKLDEFVVMPNHIHGIVIINKTTECENAIKRWGAIKPRDAINRVSTSSIIKPITPGGKTGYK